ncbi:MAG: hypothetical protein AAGI11_15310 [Pseudomonadota bacterium]
MAFREQVVDLVLRVKDLFSPGADSAASSANKLTGSADELNQKLRDLEDQKTLITQFQRSAKAVDTTGAAYDRAKLRLANLQERIDKTGVATAKQAREFDVAKRATESAERQYEEAKATLGALAKEAEASGIELGNLSEAQRSNQRETVRARRALQDLTNETSNTEKGLGRLSRSLSVGTARFLAWGAAAAAAASAATTVGLARLTGQQADLGRQTLATSEALGISTDALQVWQIAAKQVGIDAEKTSDILKDVSEKIGDAFFNEQGEAFDVIKGLNLDIKELINLSPDQQLLKIANELNGLPKSGQIQVLEALASDASLLLPLLENNAQRLRELGKAAQERNALLSEDELKGLADAEAAFVRIGLRADAFRKQIAAQLAPTLSRLADEFDAFLGRNPALIGQILAALRSLVDASAEWARGLIQDAKRVSGAFEGLAATLNFIGSTASAVFNGMRALVSGFASALAGQLTVISKAFELTVALANKVGLASDEALALAQSRTADIADTTAQLIRTTADYGKAVADSGVAAVKAFSGAERQASAAGSAVARAISAVQSFASATAESASASEKAEAQTKLMAQGQAELGRQIAATALEIEKANEAWSNDPTDENLARVEALREQYNGLQDALASLNEDVASDSAGSGANRFLENLKASANEATSAVDATAESVRAAAVETEAAGNAVQTVGQQAVRSASNAGASVGRIINGWQARIQSLSENAARAFSEALGFGRAEEAAGALSARLDYVNYQLQEMNERVAVQSSLSRVLRDWSAAALETERAFLEQAIAVERLTERLQEGDRSAQLLAMTAEDVERNFSLLDGSQLQPLIGAISSARREVDSLNASLERSLESARQEVAGLLGDQLEVERLRFERREIDLREQLAEAQRLGDQDAIRNAKELLRLAQQAYELRKRQAQQRAEQEKAEIEQERRSRSEDAREIRDRQPQIPAPEQRGSLQPAFRELPGRSVTLNLKVNGQFLGSLDGIDELQAQRLLRAIQNSSLLTTD